MFEDRGFFRAVCIISDRAKIDKLCTAIIQQKDIIGADVPMDQVVGVQGIQGAQHPPDMRGKLLPRHRSAAFEPMLQVLAFQIFHHIVGRVVQLKQVIDLYHVLQVCQRV